MSHHGQNYKFNISKKKNTTSSLLQLAFHQGDDLAIEKARKLLKTSHTLKSCRTQTERFCRLKVMENLCHKQKLPHSSIGIFEPKKPNKK